MAQETFSLRELKSMASSQLTPGSVLRRMILMEPDELPMDVAKIKAEMYLEMFYQERMLGFR